MPPVKYNSAANCKNVVGQQRSCQRVLEPMPGRIADRQKDIEPSRQRDQHQAAADLHREAIDAHDHGDGNQLAKNGRPAQPHAGDQPQLAFALVDDAFDACSPAADAVIAGSDRVALSNFDPSRLRLACLIRFPGCLRSWTTGHRYVSPVQKDFR